MSTARVENGKDFLHVRLSIAAGRRRFGLGQQTRCYQSAGAQIGACLEGQADKLIVRFRCGAEIPPLEKSHHLVSSPDLANMTRMNLSLPSRALSA
jgi:hypothetical protein